MGKKEVRIKMMSELADIQEGGGVPGAFPAFKYDHCYWEMNLEPSDYKAQIIK